MSDIKYFKSLVESALLTEAKTLIDNFDKVAQLMEFNSDDDFYFVQIIKRFKDNPNDDKTQGNYHGGAWYPFKGIRVRSAQELLALKPQIIQQCDSNNARAYITVNTRSMKDTDNQIIKVRRQYHRSDPRHIYADEIVAAQPKHGKNWKGVRKRFFIDIDPTPEYTSDPQKLQKLFSDVKAMIQFCGMTILDEYFTPSGGLHLILPDKEHEGIELLEKLLRKFDNPGKKFENWVDKGRLAMVHPNYDGKIILYSNVDTKGY